MTKKDWTSTPRSQVPKSSGSLPEHRRLEMAKARELLDTWHWKAGDNNRGRWLADQLSGTEKFYGPGAPDRIKKYMRVLQDERDCLQQEK